MGTIPVAKPSLIRRGWRPRRGIALAAILLALLGALGVGLAVVWMDDEPAWVNGGSIDQLEIDRPVRLEGHGVWLVRTSGDEVIALLSRSPHLGCGLAWRADFSFNGTSGWFVDPCHGSVFDVKGARVAGPAPRGMDQYRAENLGGTLRVYTDHVICSDGSATCDVAPPVVP